MRILILSQEPPFDPNEVATGNALRTHQLRSGLEAAGHDVTQIWLDRAGGEHCFRSADELRGLILKHRPDAILVSYWELLELLPFESLAPVVLDFLAPRPLEALFEAPERVGGMMRRLRIALARCDLILVGNREQESLLAFWLLEAGFDLREQSPVRVIGLAGDPVECHSGNKVGPVRLVIGGVHWPWRRENLWQAGLEHALKAVDPDGSHFELVRFGGTYRHQETEQQDQQSDARPLAPYQDWSDFLCKATIGLELGDGNIERRFSQSFRSLDFLRHGLPLLCSAGQPIAESVTGYQAGWVAETPADLQGILEGIKSDPDAVSLAGKQAGRLLQDHHDPAKSIAPLLQWLKDPRQAARLEGYGLPDPDPPVLGIPPMKERLGRRYRLARRIVLNRLTASKASAGEKSAIVMVSREDVFPTDHGAAVKIVETARGLSLNGREVLLVTQDRGQYWRFVNGEHEAHKTPRWLRLLARPLPWVKLDHYTRDIPESNAFLYLPLSDGSFFWRVLWVASHHHAAALQAEFPAYALPCKQVAEVLEIPCIMVEHNVEYDRLRAQVPELTSAQYETFQDLEVDLCNRCDAVICVSDNDRQKLAADGVHPGRLHTIPHGINLSSFDESEIADARGEYSIPADAPILAYHGTFAYPPNRDALVMLAEEILPRLEAQGIEAHVLAIGHQPPPSPHPRIHCTGSVETVPPWLKAADIAVVPLREGGGTRMKIIDDFAACLPVVSTSKGIEGIPVTDGKHALIRDDWDGFSAAVAELCKDPARRNELAKEARVLADKLDWTAIAARYLKLIDTL